MDGFKTASILTRGAPYRGYGFEVLPELRRNLEEFLPALMSQKTKHLYAFGPFLLDASECRLTLQGKPVPLAPKAFEALVILVGNSGHLVDKDDLMKRLWPDSFVEEANLAKHVSLLRRLLSEATNGREYIETVPKRGYRFVADVRKVAGEETASQPHVGTGANLIGKKVSHYRVLEILGGGGMGLVYKAEDLKLGRQVALKVLPEELGNDAKAAERFEREARAASALDHPNICSIYEFGEHEGQPFIVMQLLDGQTLRERIAFESQQGKPLPTSELLDLAIQVTNGLEAAHQKGIIHRDIKPANIFITNRGEAKILDFGVAKLVEGSAHPQVSDNRELRNNAVPSYATSSLLTLTLTGANLGTAGYMSPEQILGEKLDTRSDLFSFGLVLHEMATGQHPFAGETAEMVRNAILQRPVRPARQLNPELPSKVEEVIAKALEKDRNLRYQHASEMRGELEGLRCNLEPRRPFAHWRELAAGVVVVLLIVSAVLWFGKRSPSPPQRVPDLKLRQLTANSFENHVSSAVISPDGKFLAYTDATNIYVKLVETGQTRTIPKPEASGQGKTDWGIAAWFPDGVRFLANAYSLGQPDMFPVSSEGTSIWSMSALGDQPRKLRDNALAYSVSPDGTSIAFGANRGTRGDREIWLMDPDGEHARKLFESAEEDSIDVLSWMTDGQRIAYLTHDKSGDAIVARDLKGGPMVKLLSNDVIQAASDDYPFLLPDGQFIYSLPEPGTIRDTCNYWTLRTDLQTGKVIEGPKRLTNWSGFCMRNLSVTKDGRRLAFLERSGHATVDVADVFTGGTQITHARHFTQSESGDFPMEWTPDSKSLILGSNRSGRWAMYQQTLNGDTPQVLATLPFPFQYPRVSADQKWFLYLVGKEGDPPAPQPLMRVSITGSTPQQIFTARNASGISCSRRPADLCLIAEPTEDRKQLVVSSFDPLKGRGPELTRVVLDPNVDRWILEVSPDGTRLAFLKNPKGAILILSLHGQLLHKIPVSGWSNLVTLNWASDGQGLFVCDNTHGNTTDLHLDFTGHVQVLREHAGGWGGGIVPSPDGRHLAMSQWTIESNSWMLENF